jgi:hypothetical protein
VDADPDPPKMMPILPAPDWQALDADPDPPKMMLILPDPDPQY